MDITIKPKKTKCVEKVEGKRCLYYAVPSTTFCIKHSKEEFEGYELFKNEEDETVKRKCSTCKSMFTVDVRNNKVCGICLTKINLVKEKEREEVAIDLGRCVAVNSGIQCPYKASKDKIYCGIHKNIEVINKCIEDGEVKCTTPRCPRMTVDGKKKCEKCREALRKSAKAFYEKNKQKSKEDEIKID